MRLPEQYIEELAKEILGNDTIPLILYLKDKENISEFKIAEKLGVTINQVRNVLYRLNERNLVDSSRKKDKEKGWYIYSWTFDSEKARNLLLNQKRNKIENLRAMISAEEKSIFYTCPNNCIRLDNAQAMESEFKCVECNSLLKEENKERKVQQMKDSIVKINNEIAELEKVSIKEIVKVKEKLKGKPIKKFKLNKKPHIIKKPQKKFANKKPDIERHSEHKKLEKKPIIEVPKKQNILRRVKSKLFRRF